MGDMHSAPKYGQKEHKETDSVFSLFMFFLSKYTYITFSKPWGPP